MQQRTVLITGASGLIGSALCKELEARGWNVRTLSRTPRGKNAFAWNPAQGAIDIAAFEGVTHLINLAGSSIADRRWTPAVKADIIGSRLQAIATLRKHLAGTSITRIISTSAIGIYGNRGDEWLTESSAPGEGFLPKATTQWESAWQGIELPLTLFRIGIVLSNNGGAFLPLRAPLRFGIAPVPGTGKQYMSWIHIDDVVGMFYYALEHPELQGTFNAVAPEPVTTADFMNELRATMPLPTIPVPVPSTMLRLLLGEKSVLVTDSARVSGKKISDCGYAFRYTHLEEALTALHAQ